MRHAEIIGGGIGGMTAAITLARDGWGVRVSERGAGPGRSPAAIGLWPTAIKALDAIGMGEAIRAASTPQTIGDLLRPDGSVIATVDAGKLQRKTGEPVRLIPRRDLASLLVTGLAQATGEGTVRYGADVSVSDVSSGADIAIVADGVFSRSRSQLFGEAHQARYTGNTAWRGRVELAADRASETWGRGARFGITPYLDGTTNWYASAAAPEGERGDELATLRATFAGWHPPIEAILDAVPSHEIMRHDLYDLARPLDSYVAGNAALIGDAAHAMTPDLGRGACEAIIDAITLARCLREHPDVSDALAGYDEQRRRPTQRLARMSYRMSRIAQARRLVGVRDLAVRAAMKAV
jgi:2-polyprenyl-6-methoxyphenol hydroxylase-like FAD-dependent oxidoreductase